MPQYLLRSRLWGAGVCWFFDEVEKPTHPTPIRLAVNLPVSHNSWDVPFRQGVWLADAEETSHVGRSRGYKTLLVNVFWVIR